MVVVSCGLGQSVLEKICVDDSVLTSFGTVPWELE